MTNASFMTLLLPEMAGDWGGAALSASAFGGQPVSVLTQVFKRFRVCYDDSAPS
jgi:hypothetical protein